MQPVRHSLNGSGETIRGCGVADRCRSALDRAALDGRKLALNLNNIIYRVSLLSFHAQ
jgi:hypothetical protein